MRVDPPEAAASAAAEAAEAARYREVALQAFRSAGLVGQLDRALCPAGNHQDHTNVWYDDARYPDGGYTARFDLPPIYALLDERGVPRCTDYPPCAPEAILAHVGLTMADLGVFPPEDPELPVPWERTKLSDLWFELTSYDTSTRGHAARFAAYLGRFVKWYQADPKKSQCEANYWMVWDPDRGVWVPSAEEAKHLMSDMSNRLYHLALQIEDHGASKMTPEQVLALKAYRKAAASLSSASVCAEALGWAHKTLAVPPEEWNPGAWKLNTTSGVVDLETGFVSSPRSTDLMTKQTNAAWDPGAKAPRWLAYLEECVPDPEIRRHLQEHVGYALTGDITNARMVFLFGDGANGKSVFTEVVKRVLGSYGHEAPSGLLSPSDKVPTDKNDLKGKRFVAMNEVNQAATFDEAKVKELVGSIEEISARAMRENFSTFKPTHHMFVKTNHMPQLTGRDHGLWRRLDVVKFDVVPKNPDRDLVAKIAENEADGVLAWAWAGLQRLVARGKEWDTPEAIILANDEQKEVNRSDMEVFLEERVDLAPGDAVSTRDLREAYERWADEQRLKNRIKAQGFGREVRAAMKVMGWTVPAGPQEDPAVTEETRRSNVAWFVGMAIRPQNVATWSGTPL